MCYAVFVMVLINYSLLLIRKSGCSGFTILLSEWCFTLCPTPYNRPSFLPFFRNGNIKKLLNAMTYFKIQRLVERNNYVNSLKKNAFRFVT